MSKKYQKFSLPLTAFNFRIQFGKGEIKIPRAKRSIFWMGTRYAWVSRISLKDEILHIWIFYFCSFLVPVDATQRPDLHDYIIIQIKKNKSLLYCHDICRFCTYVIKTENSTVQRRAVLRLTVLRVGPLFFWRGDGKYGKKLFAGSEKTK